MTLHAVFTNIFGQKIDDVLIVQTEGTKPSAIEISRQQVSYSSGPRFQRTHPVCGGFQGFSFLAPTRRGIR